jgi:3-oxoacyl-[acyl-carrier-protein] synthase III
MNGREIVKFVIMDVPPSIYELPKGTAESFRHRLRDLSPGKPDILSKLKEEMNLTDRQYILDMKNYGNTIASTIRSR